MISRSNSYFEKMETEKEKLKNDQKEFSATEAIIGKDFKPNIDVGDEMTW